MTPRRVSSQLAPDAPFEVRAEKEGFESNRIKKTMKEGTEELITLTLKPTTKTAGGETVMKEGKKK